MANQDNSIDITDSVRAIHEITELEKIKVKVDEKFKSPLASNEEAYLDGLLLKIKQKKAQQE